MLRLRRVQCRLQGPRDRRRLAAKTGADMTSSDPKESPKSDFLAAEDIKEILAGREKAEQERIVRWVSESLRFWSHAPKTQRALRHREGPRLVARQ